MDTTGLKAGGFISMSKTVTEVSHVVLSEDSNPLQILRGGRLMEWMDLASEITAQKHAHGIALTAAVLDLRFLRKIHVGDIVTIRCQITRVFRSSMEILVEVFTQQIPEMINVKSTEGIFMMVAMDLRGIPIVLKPVIPETETEHQLYEQAGKRKQNYNKTKPPE